MKKHTIKKSIEIYSPKEKVGDVLLDPKFTNTWAAS